MKLAVQKRKGHSRGNDLRIESIDAFNIITFIVLGLLNIFINFFKWVTFFIEVR